MAETSFTPGPWETRHMNTPYIHGEDDGDNYFGVIAVEPMRGRIDSSITGMSKANARLIAAAPDLYAALLDIVNYRGGAINALADDNVMDRADEALAKAVQK